jgi:hypothetical protein
MFTQGQIDVVEEWLLILEAQFKPNVTPVCVEIPEYIITDDTVTACNGLFYDSGGVANGTDQGNYQNNENFTYTICPETAGQSIQLSFTQFETQNNVDILEIFNGADTSAATLGQWSGTDSPGTVVPTNNNPSGCLTVVFTSNGSVNLPGWRANVQCVEIPALSSSVNNINSINLYPNPVENTLYINTLNENMFYSLYDVNGKNIYSTNDKFIPMGKLSTGIYILRIIGDNHTSFKRIIKK